MTTTAAAWGSVLQEKYASARSVACCPTMDLIAILTTDRQLFVHRTISWQRILHIKPSDVFFTMETLVWSPDGMRLAVGCDEGELVVFSMATAGDDKGVEIKPHSGEDELRHANAIVAMHWVQVRNQGTDDAPGHSAAKTPSAALRDRRATFLARPGSDAASQSAGTGTSVLVTADSAGRIGIWWNGLVLVAVVPLQKLSTSEPHNGSRSGSPTVTIHSVMLASDLSALFVDASHDAQQDGSDSPRRRCVLRVDLHTSLQAVQRDLGIVSRVGYEVRSIFEVIRTSLRQISSEWKNATRVFELKMSLIGSLYEKYGCEEPPQVDMLAIIAGGIASPALAQYFAQDIQEMSVIRMQKTFFSGCDTIRTLACTKIKAGLQQILFEVAELRGSVRWNYKAFSETLGISTNELDTVIDGVGNLITTLEQFEKMLHETRQDLSLLFTWLLERIRIHTNDGNARPTSSSSNENAHKSLLNVRRLVTFLERAAQSAREHQVKKNNKWLVEVTFGNQVSKVLASMKLTNDVNDAERQWSATMAEMIRALSHAISPRSVSSLDLGKDVDEVQLHTRWVTPSRTDPSNDAGRTVDEDEDTSEDDEGEESDTLEAVDWDSLESIRAGKSHELRDRTPVSMVTVRHAHDLTFFTSYEGRGHSEWKTSRLQLGFLCDGDSQCAGGHRMCLYGGISGGKQEQLVVVDTQQKERGTAGIYLVGYDTQLQRSLTRPQSTTQILTLGVGSEVVRLRTYRSVSSSSNSALDTVLATQASRGIVCVISGGVRLLVLDAEDGGDDEMGEDDDLGNGRESDDHDEGDL